MGADFHKTTGTVAARDFYFSKGTNVFFFCLLLSIMASFMAQPEFGGVIASGGCSAHSLSSQMADDSSFFIVTNVFKARTRIRRGRDCQSHETVPYIIYTSAGTLFFR